MNEREIWFLAGASGGHIFPLLTIYKNIHEREGKYIFWTDSLSLSVAILNKEKALDLDLVHHVLFYPKPGPGIGNVILFIFFTFFHFFKFVWRIFMHAPSDIYLSGGYIGIPVAVAVYVLNFFLFKKITVHLYHLDVLPGKAARFISFFKSCQYVVYEETKDYIYKKNKIEKIMYPVRYKKNDIFEAEYAKKMLSIKQDKKVVMILGGSQGSQELNNLIEEMIPIFLSFNCFVIHQAGRSNKERIEKLYMTSLVDSLVFEFRDDVNIFFSVSDIVISRAGAGTIAEIIFFKKKAILIPLKGVSHNHQELNALAAKKDYPDIEIFSTIEKLKITLISKLSLL